MLKTTLTSERGFALVAALLVVAVLFVFAMGLLFQSRTERLVAANEHDHLAALGHADAGMSWAESRFWSATSLTDLLLGPDDTTATADDNLFGLRDLSLTATTQFTSANEDTASAIVSRDFDGQGAKSWEAIRVAAGGNAHALVYVRIDDNFDDDPDDPANNDPLTDKDRRAQVTVVAEYPVFADGAGVETTPAADRGRAERTLVAVFGHGTKTAALSSDGDIDLGGSNVEVCGECGSVHANQDLNVAGASVCVDATASGALSGSTTGVGGNAAGGESLSPLPVINPYDDLYVPTIETFDTSGDSALPLGLRCPVATATDPGASKYFAFVSNGSKGEVWKAYWDFTNDRWTWRMIDDLADNTEVMLDDCGRVEDETEFEAGNAGAVNDGKKSEFFGFLGAKFKQLGCAACGGGSADKSLCGLANNDFNATGYYPTGGGGLVAAPPLPGNFQPDGNVDFIADWRVSSDWSYSSKTVYSPLYGAVVWIYGGLGLSGNAGETSPADLVCSAGAGCTATVMPRGTWRCSIIAVGGVDLGGSANIGPANALKGYHYLIITGRDLRISGNAQADTRSCNDSCPTSGPSDVADISGVYGIHEQFNILGNPNIFGFMIAEDALNCDNKAGPLSTMLGNPEIYYDCQHPPNPWSTAKERLSWREVE